MINFCIITLTEYFNLASVAKTAADQKLFYYTLICKTGSKNDPIVNMSATFEITRVTRSENTHLSR